MEIVVEAPEDMNLLGLFVAAALEERTGALTRSGLKDEIALTARHRSGRLGDRVRRQSGSRRGEMSITLGFQPGRVTIRRGVAGSPRAHVKGSLASLVTLARGRTARAVMTGRVRVSGNPLAALPLAKVLSAAPDARETTGA